MFQAGESSGSLVFLFFRRGCQHRNSHTCSVMPEEILNAKKSKNEGSLTYLLAMQNQMNMNNSTEAQFHHEINVYFLFDEFAFFYIEVNNNVSNPLIFEITF